MPQKYNNCVIYYSDTRQANFLRNSESFAISKYNTDVEVNFFKAMFLYKLYGISQRVVPQIDMKSTEMCFITLFPIFIRLNIIHDS